MTGIRTGIGLGVSFLRRLLGGGGPDPEPVVPDGVITDGLAGYYDFVEGANSAVLYDASGNGRHGTVANATWTAQGLKVNDGVNSSVIAPGAAAGGSGAGTLVVVAKLTASGSFSQLINGRDGNGYDKGLLLMFEQDQRRYRLGMLGGMASTSAVAATPLDTWSFYAARFTPSTSVDGWEARGSLAKTINITASVPATRPVPNEVLFGWLRSDGAGRLYGSLATAALYNRALSDAEISDTYDALQTELASRSITI